MANIFLNQHWSLWGCHCAAANASNDEMASSPWLFQGSMFGCKLSHTSRQSLQTGRATPELAIQLSAPNATTSQALLLAEAPAWRHDMDASPLGVVTLAAGQTLLQLTPELSQRRSGTASRLCPKFTS